jgi:hypothetical protein
MCAQASPLRPRAPVGGAQALSLPRPPDHHLGALIHASGAGVDDTCNGVYHPPVRVVELSTPLLVECLSDDDDDDDDKDDGVHGSNHYDDRNGGSHDQRKNALWWPARSYYPAAPGPYGVAPPSPVPSMGSDGSVSWFDMDELMRSTEYAGLKDHHDMPSGPTTAGRAPGQATETSSPRTSFSLARSPSSSSSQWSN